MARVRAKRACVTADRIIDARNQKSIYTKRIESRRDSVETPNIELRTSEEASNPAPVSAIALSPLRATRALVCVPVVQSRILYAAWKSLNEIFSVYYEL